MTKMGVLLFISYIVLNVFLMNYANFNITEVLLSFLAQFALFLSILENTKYRRNKNG